MGILTMFLTTKIINYDLDMKIEENQIICPIKERTSNFYRWITLRHNVHCLSSTTTSQTPPDMPGDVSPGSWHILRKPRNCYHISRHFQVSNFGLKCPYFACAILQAYTLILMWFLFLIFVILFFCFYNKVVSWMLLVFCASAG